MVPVGGGRIPFLGRSLEGSALWSWWRATTRGRGAAENKRRGEGTIKRPSCVHQYPPKPAKTLASRLANVLHATGKDIRAPIPDNARLSALWGTLSWLLIWALLPRVYKLQYRGHLSILSFRPVLSLSLEIQEKRFAWKRADLSLTRHRFVAELRSLRGWDQFREWNWGRRLIFNSWLKGWAKVGAIFIIIRGSLYFFFFALL